MQICYIIGCLTSFGDIAVIGQFRCNIETKTKIQLILYPCNRKS